METANSLIQRGFNKQALIFQTRYDTIPFIMKTISSFLLLSILTLICFSCSFSKKDEGPSNIVLVSIAPYKYFVEQIAGNTVTVDLMVPTGASPHSYEPNSRAIIRASKADAWFRIGEGFEKRAMQAMKSHNPSMEITDLRKGIKTIHHHHGHGSSCQHEDCRDPHIWLSPREAKKQAEIIYEVLSSVYPEHQEKYHKALRQFQLELDDLDLEIEGILRTAKSKTLLVSHPAYAYLCRDYGFKQISIEFEGKEPSPQQLTKLLEMTQEQQIKTVFVQAQHLSKGARLVAKELNAEVVELDPLAENYPENLRDIAHKIADQ